MSEESNNLGLWERHFKPHKDALKPFRRKGGFNGTAIDPMWLVREATSEWGPLGKDWGYTIENEQYVDGAPIVTGGSPVCNEVIHILRLRLWYPGGEVFHFGQTVFVGVDKNGPFTDEEAPKKSLTDALSKALSMLGFGAAVHMGMFDGNKYVDLPKGGEKPEPPAKKQPEREPPPPEPPPEPTAKAKPDPVERIKKYLLQLKESVGPEDAKKRWVTLLAHSDNSCGALDLKSLIERANVSQLWSVSEELKGCVLATKAQLKEKESEVREDSVPAPEQE